MTLLNLEVFVNTDNNIVLEQDNEIVILTSDMVEAVCKEIRDLNENVLKVN